MSVLFPDLDRGSERGEITDQELQRQVEIQLRSIVIGAMADLGVRSPMSVEDMTRELTLRVATMNAAERFDPSRASPTTYLRGIARRVVREQFHRRERPVTVPNDAIDRMGVDGSQLDRAMREERRLELKLLLDRLSPGEVRAVIHEFGPIAGYSPPIGPRRRLRDPDALPRAIEILRNLGAHQNRQ